MLSPGLPYYVIFFFACDDFRIQLVHPISWKYLELAHKWYSGYPRCCGILTIAATNDIVTLFPRSRIATKRAKRSSLIDHFLTTAGGDQRVTDCHLQRVATLTAGLIQ